MTQAPPERANAAIVMLARNREVNDVAASMKQMEDRFNSRYGYPWVFLNDEPFSEEFIRSVILVSPFLMFMNTNILVCLFSNRYLDERVNSPEPTSLTV